MRTGQVVVIALAAATLGVASGAWIFQRSLMQRHRREPAPPALRPRAPSESFERRVAPGGVPAAPIPSAAVVAAPGGVPSAWAEKNNQAIAALEQGDHERAIEGFEECRAAFPELAVFATNLAEALTRAALLEHESDARCKRCVERLERACLLAPQREDIAKLLERWKQERAVEGEFWIESSLHFEISYDGQRRDLLWGSTRMLDQLERAYADLGLLFGSYPVERGRPRFRVVLYEREGFSKLTGLGDWAGGAFDGTAIRIPIGDLAAEESRLARVFRHELCHAFVREIGGEKVPGWLNEGLAQWLEAESEERRGEEARAAAKVLGKGEVFPLGELGGSLAGWKDVEAIERAYLQSLVFVDFLWREYGQRGVIGMVEGCGRGEGVEKSFEKETRVALVRVFEAWVDGRK